MIAAEKKHEDDLYAALWKQDEQVKAAREVAETAEQIKRNQGFFSFRTNWFYTVFRDFGRSSYSSSSQRSSTRSCTACH